MNNPEQLQGGSERGLENLGEAAAERQAELLKSGEKTVENSPEKKAEAAAEAAKEAHELAVTNERPSHELAAAAPASAPRVTPINNKDARKKAYKDIIRHAQSEMGPAQRAFSKVIHQPVVEKVSGVAGRTVARPNAILFGALFALILSGAVYAVAKYYGYTLSGFEAIGSFVVGWAVGMAVDFIRITVRGR